MEFDTVDKLRYAFYRLVGTDASDQDLIEQGESTGDIANLFLTRGCRSAQRWMLKTGHAGWRKRSDALVWSGSDATTGGRYSSLPSDFLRAYGNFRRSALVRANGDLWGQQIDEEQDYEKGDKYYFRGSDDGGFQLWLARTAGVPSTLYLDFHYQHPVFESLADLDIDFPMEARPLIPAFAADKAKTDNWLPGGPEMTAVIREALATAKEEARDIARATKQPRTMRKSVRYGNRW